MKPEVLLISDLHSYFKRRVTIKKLELGQFRFKAGFNLEDFNSNIALRLRDNIKYVEL